MGFINSLAVRAKLMLLVGVMLAGIVVSTSFGLLTAHKIDSSSEFMYDRCAVPLGLLANLQNDWGKTRATFYKYKANMISQADYQKTLDDFLGKTLAEFNAAYAKTYIDANDEKAHKDLIAKFDTYKGFANKYFTSLANNNIDEANRVLKDEWAPAGNIVNKSLDELVVANIKAAKDANSSSKSIAESGTYLLIIISAVVGLVGVIIAIAVTSNITSSAQVLQKGLLAFFDYLSFKSAKAQPIILSSNDEFGQMARGINENISKIETNIRQDAQFIESVKKLANEMKHGHFLAKVDQNATNPGLQELKTVFNDVQDTIEHKVARDLNLIFSVLDSYARHDFTANIPNAYGQVAVAINKLGEEISSMLKESLQNGYDLLGNANELSGMVSQLSTSSNQQAASLEETAASLEEITSVIRETANRANDMAKLSALTKKSAEHGMSLTVKTVDNMNEIDKATLSINEAVVIIENIAFQTNILSLNAAVEAATAGDAGKGFAVVAQEVRNLANRSAEAAKNIKELVEQANQKTAEGKSASNEMMTALRELNERIDETTNMVENVAKASKEQMSGVDQINDAVTQLDQMTQENASVANSTSMIADNVSSMANELVSNADKKQFTGKESVSRVEMRSVTKKRNTSVKTIAHSSPKMIPNHQSVSNSADQWDSF